MTATLEPVTHINTSDVLYDIKMLSAREGTEKADWDAVGRLYQIRFETLFETFEQLIKDRALL